MFGILCKLLENEKTTAKELADYFEVSTRTIYRDLLDLSSAGFPVVTQQGIGGGVFSYLTLDIIRRLLIKKILG